MRVYDPVRTLYRTLLIFDIVAILILAAGLTEFFYFEPPGQQTGLTATITGVYQYDAATNKTFGAERSTFTRTQLFAAVVDWKSLPPNVTVDARWYDNLESIVGSVGPGTPAQLENQPIVPIALPTHLKHNLPGQYIFVVERWANGIPVEVIARRIDLVERS